MREPNTPPRPNRAARRGKATGPLPDALRHRVPAVPSRSAQGRRVTPIRRTG